MDPGQRGFLASLGGMSSSSVFSTCGDRSHHKQRVCTVGGPPSLSATALYNLVQRTSLWKLEVGYEVSMLASLLDPATACAGDEGIPAPTRHAEGCSAREGAPLDRTRQQHWYYLPC